MSDLDEGWILDDGEELCPCGSGLPEDECAEDGCQLYGGDRGVITIEVGDLL